MNVRARNVETGVIEETETAANGTYALTLGPGKFDVFLRKPSYSIATKRDVAIVPGQTTKLDVVLSPTANNGVPGEQAYLMLTERVAKIDGPAPKRPTAARLLGDRLPSLDMDAD